MNPSGALLRPRNPDGATFLVAGGAGFIGSHLVDLLLRRYPAARVLTLDRLTYAGSLDNLEEALDDPRHEFVQGDICDRRLASRLAARADFVLNLAAETHVDRAILDGEPFARTDALGTAVLLEAFRQAGRGQCFVQVSTDEVYGPIPAGEVDEDAPLAPKNPYAASKAAGDLLCLAYKATHRLPVLISRGANTYGPRQHREKMIPTFVRAALAGEALPSYGDGLQVREWLHVRDHCEALDFLLRLGSPGGVYNVGSGDRRTNLEVAGKLLALVERATGRRGAVGQVADRPGPDRRYAVDSTRLRDLGWKPRTPLGAGLEETVEALLPGRVSRRRSPVASS